MIFKYVGNGEFIQGLPAIDINDSNLDDSQKKLLAEAIAAGLYKAPLAAPQADKPKADPQK